VIVLLSTGGTLARTLPLISLYALAGYRLMPALREPGPLHRLCSTRRPRVLAPGAEIVIRRRHAPTQVLLSRPPGRGRPDPAL
jgi:hypothetical protein